MNNEVKRKEIYFAVRGFLANSPIIMKVDILPVEPWEYKNCVQEMEFFAVNLVKYADVSLAVRLIRELLNKLPGMFPPNINQLLDELEKKSKENKENKNESKKEV